MAAEIDIIDDPSTVIRFDLVHVVHGRSQFCKDFLIRFVNVALLYYYKLPKGIVV